MRRLRLTVDVARKAGEVPLLVPLDGAEVAVMTWVDGTPRWHTGKVVSSEDVVHDDPRGHVGHVVRIVLGEGGSVVEMFCATCAVDLEADAMRLAVEDES